MTTDSTSTTDGASPLGSASSEGLGRAPAANDTPTPAELPTMVLHDSFGDAEALFNLRDWLESALVAKGALVTGKGCGMGAADLSIRLDGFEFFVTIKPTFPASA